MLSLRASLLRRLLRIQYIAFQWEERTPKNCPLLFENPDPPPNIHGSSNPRELTTQTASRPTQSVLCPTDRHTDRQTVCAITVERVLIFAFRAYIQRGQLSPASLLGRKIEYQLCWGKSGMSPLPGGS